MTRALGPRRTRERRARILAAAAAAALLVAACWEAPPEDAPPVEHGDAVALELVADNVAFHRESLTVPAGAPVRLRFENHDGTPHNFALHGSEAAEEPIFRGDVTSEDVTYEFRAPDEPGTYFFRCDPHPTQMTGDFIVEGSAAPADGLYNP